MGRVCLARQLTPQSPTPVPITQRNNRQTNNSAFVEKSMSNAKQVSKLCQSSGSLLEPSHCFVVRNLLKLFFYVLILEGEEGNVSEKH